MQEQTGRTGEQGERREERGPGLHCSCAQTPAKTPAGGQPALPTLHSTTHKRGAVTATGHRQPGVWPTSPAF